MTNWAHMTALLAGIPELPGARCKGNATELFEVTIDERRTTNDERRTTDDGRRHQADLDELEELDAFDAAVTTASADEFNGAVFAATGNLPTSTLLPELPFDVHLNINQSASQLKGTTHDLNQPLRFRRTALRPLVFGARGGHQRLR